MSASKGVKESQEREKCERNSLGTKRTDGVSWKRENGGEVRGAEEVGRTG